MHMMSGHSISSADSPGRSVPVSSRGGGRLRRGRDNSSFIYDRPEHWHRHLAIARMGVLSLLAMGVAFIKVESGAEYLVALFVTAFAVNAWHLRALQRKRPLQAAHGRAQIGVDFAVVALTILVTHGPTSIFTFMFTVVVLEAGLLLGFPYALATATLASIYMFVQAAVPGAGSAEITAFELWVNFIVQSLAFYLTACVSGYWSQRIFRMQQFQREILDNMNSGFLITDMNGLITVQNEAARRILELSDADIVGRPAGEVLCVESGEECPLLTALRLGRDYASYEFAAISGKGQRVLLGLTTSRMTDAAGRVTGLIASFSDLTEVTQMRDELRRQDRLAVVGELAAGLAHEIRNPVAIIRGAVDEMSSQTSSGHVQEKLRTMIMRESGHLNEIVTGFLDFAREPSPTRVRCDVVDVARDVASLLQREYAARSTVTVELVAPASPCEVWGDASQLKQVFVNLGKNAIEAMHENGRLEITIVNGLGPVEIRFDDEGPGIDPDKISRIFEPFFTTKKSGVGMGLAVCMRIITAHDGTIRASSRKGGGCSMSVLLPSAKYEADNE